MADQSTLQTLLQQGVGLQSNAQNNTAMTPNNGNPNTIYNLAAPNVRQFNPATGALPAMGDANGNWAVPAQGLSPALQQILSNNVQQTNIRPTVPAGMFTIPPVIIPSLPGPTPTTPPGPTPWTPPTPATGTNVDPNTQLPPDVLEALGRVGGGAQTGGTTWDSYANPGFTGNFSGGIGSGAAVDRTGGYGADIDPSNVNWQQVVDVAGDAMGLPGNWYLGNTGKWDVSNILTSLGSTVTGLPIGNLLTKLGQAVANGDGNVPGVPAWLERAALSHYMDNTQNTLTGGLNASQQNMMNKVATGTNDKISQDAANAMRKMGLDPNAGQYTGPTGYVARPTPGAVAGASSIGGTYIDAKGNTQFDTAGQEMFANMRLAQMARGERQTGADLSGRPYSK